MVKITDVLAAALERDTPAAEDLDRNQYTYSIMIAAYYIGFDYIESCSYSDDFNKTNSCDHLERYCEFMFNVDDNHNLSRVVSWQTVKLMFQEAYLKSTEMAASGGIKYPLVSTFIWAGCYGFGDMFSLDETSPVSGS